MRRWRAVIFICALPIAAAVHADTLPRCGSSGVQLQVLGSGGPDLPPGRAATGYLVWLNGRARVLIDAGGGTALRFAETGAHASDIDVVLFTQLQVDHTADFATLVGKALLEQRTRPLRVYGPPGNRFAASTVTFVRTLFDSTRGAWRHLGDVVSPLARDGLRLEPHDVRVWPRPISGRRDDSDGVVDVANIDGLRIAAAAVIHGVYPALAWRVAVNGKTIVLSGDMNGEGEGMPRLSQGADLLVMHHAVLETASGVDRYLHMPPSVIGALAAGAEAKQLVLTHRTRPTLGHEDESSGFIRKRYSGPLTFADDLACFAP